MKCIQKSREYMCLQYMPSSPKFWAKLGELLPNQLYKIDESCYDLRLELKINDSFIKVRKGDYILIDKDECINILSKEKFERDYCIIKESEGKENG